MNNKIDYEELEGKLKKTPPPNNKIFLSGKKGGVKYETKTVVIKNIVRKEKISVNGKVGVVNKIFNAQSIKNALYYINKNAENMKDDNGNVVEVNELLKDWNKSLSKNKEHSEGLHYVFSIDEDKTLKNYEALEKSVKDTLSLFFSDYKYGYVVHKHQNNPHVHVIINKHNIHTNTKFTLKTKQDTRNFFNDMRENFKDNLNYYNSNFNYKNYYRVEKNLIQKMMKEELKEMTTQQNFSKEIRTDIKTELKSMKSFLDEIKNKKEANFKNIDITKNKKEVLKDVTTILKKDEKLNKQQKRTSKNINYKELFSTNIEEIQKSNKLIDFQNELNYFETPAQKRLMSLTQYKKFITIKKDFENFKFQYNKEFKNKVMIEDKDKIKFLSTRTSSWIIDKNLKLISNRRLEYAKLYNNADENVLKQLDKNYDDMINLFKARADFVHIFIKDLKSQLQYENNTNEYMKIDKKIIGLQKELNFIEHIKSKQNMIDTNKKDENKFVKDFIKKVDLLHENTSAFKIDKLIIEAKHRKMTKELPEGIKKDFNSSIDKLEKSLSSRRKKVFNNIEFITIKISNEKDDEKREKLKDDLQFFKKEHKFIKENYQKDTTIKISNEKER